MAKKVIQNTSPDVNDDQFFMIDSNGTFFFKGNKLLGAINEQEVLNELRSLVPINTGLMPDNCIYYSTSGNCTSLILEYKPGLKKIKYLDKYDELEKFTGRIFYPYLYVVLTVCKEPTSKEWRLERSYLFGRVTKLTSISDRIYRMHLPNLHGDGRICWGTQKMSADKTSLCNFVNTAMDGFWQSNCNGDLSLYLPKFLKPAISETMQSQLKRLSELPIETFLNQEGYHDIGTIQDFVY